MGLFRSGNPALKRLEQVAANQREGAATVPMTLQGTINKTIILLLLMLFSGSITWKLITVSNALGFTLMIGGAIGGFILALVGIFAPKTIHIIAPLYALFEGLFIGAISAIYGMLFAGIVLQAVLLTIAIFISILLLYKFKILKASAAFVKGIVIATGGVALYYIVVIVASYFFGKDFSVFAMGWVGIVIQLVIVGIAALNLVLDFNLIETGVENGYPKKMEWYGAFSLMITLIWLYIEILRLLAILNRRN